MGFPLEYYKKNILASSLATHKAFIMLLKPILCKKENTGSFHL